MSSGWFFPGKLAYFRHWRLKKELPNEFPSFLHSCQMFSSFDPLGLLIIAAVFLIAIACHEAAHAYVAYKLGDPTPKMEDRLTLNPMAHLDIIGTIAIFAVGFGWGKPVRVNPSFFRDKRRDMMLVALAGPMANFGLAFVAAGVSALLLFVAPDIAFTEKIFFSFVQTLLWVNVFLGVFNLIPLPPLDGGSVLLGLLPKHLVPSVREFLEMHGQITFFILLAVNLFFNIPIITGPVGFISGKIVLFFQLVFAF